MNTRIRVLKWPKEEDWLLCKECALVTVGKEAAEAPSTEWRHAILRAKHSPIRVLQFAFLLEDVPYYVSTHLARHVHAQPFIRSQRNDRQAKYDRRAARQDAPVDMIWYMSVEELMMVAEKRLCVLADVNTRAVVRMICALAVDKCPELDGLLGAPCKLTGQCREMHPCERGGRLQAGEAMDGNYTGD